MYSYNSIAEGVFINKDYQRLTIVDTFEKWKGIFIYKMDNGQELELEDLLDMWHVGPYINKENKFVDRRYNFLSGHYFVPTGNVYDVPEHKTIKIEFVYVSTSVLGVEQKELKYYTMQEIFHHIYPVKEDIIKENGERLLDAYEVTYMNAIEFVDKYESLQQVMEQTKTKDSIRTNWIIRLKEELDAFYEKIQHSIKINDND